MFRFFESNPFVGFRHFRIPFPVSHPAHGQIHANFGAFTGEVLTQAFQDPFIHAFGNAYHVFISVFLHAFLQFIELVFGSAALRALFRSFFPFIHITAHSANEFFHNIASPKWSSLLFKDLLFVDICYLLRFLL